jgi:hypothetical protein
MLTLVHGPRPFWSGHMMMMGSLLPGWDSRSAGARPFKLPRPPVTRFLPRRNLGDGLTAALQEPVAQPIGGVSGPFSFCRNGTR